MIVQFEFANTKIEVDLIDLLSGVFHFERLLDAIRPNSRNITHSEVEILNGKQPLLASILVLALYHMCFLGDRKSIAYEVAIDPLHTDRFKLIDHCR